MKYWHEIQHCITISDYYSILSRLKQIIARDNNAGDGGEYRIRSLYFDNLYDKILLEKQLGINNRDKFRIRYYNDNLSTGILKKDM